MSRLIYHIAHPGCLAQLGDSPVQLFRSWDDFLSRAETSPSPWLFVLELSAPKSSFDSAVAEPLSWIKRHPKFHFCPVIIVVKKLSGEQREQLSRAGAFGIVESPYSTAEFSSLLEKLERMTPDPAELDELDLVFLGELLERISTAYSCLNLLNEASLRKLYHSFHTIKGSARTLEFLSLSTFMHSAEGLLDGIERGKLYQVAQSRELLLQVVNFLERQSERLRSRTLLDDSPSGLLEEIARFEARVRAGWRGDSEYAPPQSLQTENGVMARTSQSVRISLERLSSLEQKFRGILALRTKLSRFANDLNSEFFDEPFPKTLQQLVDDLNREASEVMDFFISLRLVPVQQLRAFAQRVLDETSLDLKKPATLVFQCENALSVDQSVYSCVETALLHLIRNAMDHGLESPEVRARLGKSPIGTIRVEIEEDGSEHFCVNCSDDGAGIDLESIKAAVENRGFLTRAALDQMPSEEISQLIFSDQISTSRKKTEISGRGVGLSAVRQKILELQGKIEVKSEQDKGSSFQIILPKVFRT